MLNKKILFEVTDKNYTIIPSKKLLDFMKTDLNPLLESKGEAFIVNCANGHHMHGMIFRADNPRATIMISHGFTESWNKFREMIYYFLGEGLNVVIHSHWNHGDSRDEAPNGNPTHIDEFQSYVDDFSEVVNQKLSGLPSPYYLYCHSMGGLIGALYVEQNPDTFKKAIFSAPMFEINRGGLPYFLAKDIARVLCFWGRQHSYLPGQAPFSDKEDFENSAANCKERYLNYFNEQKANPNLQNCGCSCKWALESFLSSEKLLKEENCSKVTIPVLLFQAEHDSFVLPGGQDKFISSIKNGSIVYVPNSKHEIYLAPDDILGRYLSVIFDFLA